ncbi:hypothetical protein [Rhizobium paknamense]|uniref:Uncharacterized protein n=1 Tax=Rhizobium paknamense TaxID=1206817 RepID=A0ABU0IBV3_9HYPH|nr:hypothetical protein [Rhizobium paknamense]MDQ0454940.1 hypothetical protein [Rhizobium paknamense]
MNDSLAKRGFASDTRIFPLIPGEVAAFQAREACFGRQQIMPWRMKARPFIGEPGSHKPGRQNLNK